MSLFYRFRYMSLAEKALILAVIIHIAIWFANYNHKISAFYLGMGVVILVIAYLLVYALVRLVMDSFAKEILKLALNYIFNEYKIQKFEFTYNYYSGITRNYSALIFIGLLIVDGISLWYFEHSILSRVNALIYREYPDFYREYPD